MHEEQCDWCRKGTSQVIKRMKRVYIDDEGEWEPEYVCFACLDADARMRSYDARW